MAEISPRLPRNISDDPGSKDSGGLYADADVSQWVRRIQETQPSQQTIGTIGDPVETEYGYHVIKVESRSVKSFDSVKEQLKCFA